MVVSPGRSRVDEVSDDLGFCVVDAGSFLSEVADDAVDEGAFALDVVESSKAGNFCCAKVEVKIVIKTSQAGTSSVNNCLSNRMAESVKGADKDVI